jgi:hypothetical protein
MCGRSPLASHAWQVGKDGNIPRIKPVYCQSLHVPKAICQFFLSLFFYDGNCSLFDQVTALTPTNAHASASCVFAPPLDLSWH